jgi:putative transposase
VAEPAAGPCLVYAAVFIDAIVVKVRDGQVTNRPVYAAIGVTLEGCKDILGLWAGSGGEGAKFWMAVLTDLKNRGIGDVFFVVCDGLKGLPEVVGSVWPLATVQTCIIHLIRNTFRLASKRDWDAIKRGIRPIYTAVNADAAAAALDELEEQWGRQYGAIIRLWRNAWTEFTPFLDYDLEIRAVRAHATGRGRNADRPPAQPDASARPSAAAYRPSCRQCRRARGRGRKARIARRQASRLGQLSA